jgi:hypothetical protein
MEPLPRVPDPKYAGERGMTIDAPTPKNINIPNPWKPKGEITLGVWAAGRGSGRRIASIYTWAATLPGAGRCLAMTVNGNHDVGIAVEPEGFVPDCRTCHLPGRPYQTALEAAEAIHAHAERVPPSG